MSRLVALIILFLSLNAQAEHQIDTPLYRLQFSATGELIGAQVCFPACGMEDAQMAVLGGTENLLSFGSTSPPWEMSRLDWENGTVIRFARGPWYREYMIHSDSYQLRLNIRGPDRKIRVVSGADFVPEPAAGFGHWLEQLRYLWWDQAEVRRAGLGDEEAFPAAETESRYWFGFRKRFWAMLIKPRQATVRQFSAADDAIAALDLGTGEDLIESSFQIYLGPVEPEALSRVAPELEDIMYSGLWFWLRWICMGLFQLLMWIQQLIPGWGWAIMALSLTVKILMWPLNRIADKFQHQVNDTQARLEPRLDAIKQQYKGEEQSQRILALFKQEGVSPLYSLKALFGVAVLIPVFIGAFDMLAENIHLAGQSFFWIKDLARPDGVMALPFRIPFFGNELNLLPFIMTGLSVWTSYLHQPPAMTDAMRQRQFRNLLLMALVFFVLFYTFPAGMVLYWATNNLISVIKDGWKHGYGKQAKEL